MYRKRIVIQGVCAPGERLENFPLVLALTDPGLRDLARSGTVADAGSGGIRFRDPAGAVLDHEIAHLDPIRGILRAWVSLPELTTTAPGHLTVETAGSGGDTGASPVWDPHFRLVIHDAATPRDATRCGQRLRRTEDGAVVVAAARTLAASESLTVEAWVEEGDGRAETLQAIVSCWSPRAGFAAVDAYDAGHTSGLETMGFFGAVFDGRHVYFVPQHDRQSRHGKVLRCDTHGDFRDPASWEGYDAGHTDGLVTKGYYGAVHAAPYVYFVPRLAPDGLHTRVLRYDTRRAFADPASWQAHDAGFSHSCQSAAFDGRYIYFCPGQERCAAAGDARPSHGPCGSILRHDTHAAFHDPEAWTAHDASGTAGHDTRDFDGAVYDGRFVYFMPLAHGAVLRLDTRGDYHDPGSWTAFDAAPLGVTQIVGGVFDGRYVYLSPYGSCTVAVRYDTRLPFGEAASWEAYRLAATPGLPVSGYDGAFFDGRYVTYIPFYDGGTRFHGVTLRYDATRPFADPTSWEWFDASVTAGLATVGFNGGATDGRYLYFAPWRDATGFPERIAGHGRVLRCDTLGEQGAFSLRYSDVGHNGGLCAALPGARFLVNTDRGIFSVAENRPPRPGRRYLAGVYDGRSLRLYIDGECVAEQPASGTLLGQDIDTTIGSLLGGLGRLHGRITEVRLSTVARTAAWIRATFRTIAEPERYCSVVDP